MVYIKYVMSGQGINALLADTTDDDVLTMSDDVNLTQIDDIVTMVSEDT